MLIGECIHDPAVARERAENGAAYLDQKFGPDWDRVIDAARLDIGTFVCILGQLARHGMICLPSPRRGVDCGFTCGVVMDVLVLLSHLPLIGRHLPLSRVVRSYALLTDAWREVLLRRRQPLPAMTHEAAATPAATIREAATPPAAATRPRRRARLTRRISGTNRVGSRSSRVFRTRQSPRIKKCAWRRFP
jgi:hypothetical protein